MSHLCYNLQKGVIVENGLKVRAQIYIRLTNIIYKKEKDMNKSLIVKIGGTISALIFALGAFLPLASIEFFGTKMSKSLADGRDWIFVAIDAVLAIGAFWLSEDVSVDVCAAAATLIAYGKLKPFFDGSAGEASQFITKGAGFYCLLIGAVLLIIFGIGLWFIKDTPKKKKKKKELTKKMPVLCRKYQG